MRTLHNILMVPLAVLCAFFLIRFARIEYALWQMRDGAGFRLLAEPHICVYRAFTRERKERDGWTFFLLADPPEGTRAVFYFPTWPAVVASAGLLAYAVFILFDRKDRRAV